MCRHSPRPDPSGLFFTVLARATKIYRRAVRAFKKKIERVPKPLLRLLSKTAGLRTAAMSPIQEAASRGGAALSGSAKEYKKESTAARFLGAGMLGAS